MKVALFDRRRFLTQTAQGSLAICMASAVHASSPKTEAGLSLNATPREVSESYWRAEHERNVDKVGLHWHHDAVFMPPGERLVGWENIRKWYEATYRQLTRVQVDIVHVITQGPEASVEWHATLTNAAGKLLTPVGVNVVRVEGGKFRWVRAYFDSSVLR